MTGHDKKMHYPEIYLIRVDKKLKEKLRKIDSNKIREHLHKLSEESS